MKDIPNVYAIISTSDIDKINFSQVFENNNGGLRYSLNLTKFVIKWNNKDTPSFIADGTVTPLEVMTHTQALTLMASPEWAAPIDEGFVNKPAQIKL